MGASKIKRAKQKEIAAAESCIYCGRNAQQVEHMPPIGMFRNNQRPKGMEYAICATCNQGTREVDAVAIFLALQSPEVDRNGWKAKKIRDLVSTLKQRAPEVMEEIIQSRIRNSWVSIRGIFHPVVAVRADGPLVRAHLDVFGIKLAMALFREHIGKALPSTGAVFSQSTLNAGMSESKLESMLKILPMGNSLQQGKKNVHDQFLYRYNTDGTSIVASVVEFHSSLWFTVFVSDDPRYINVFNPNNEPLPPASVVAYRDDFTRMVAGLKQSCGTLSPRAS